MNKRSILPYVLATKDEGPAYAFGLVQDTVKVMEKNGDGRKPLWITETGISTNTVTEQKQAEHLTGIYLEMAKIPEVKAVYWFLLRDMDRSVCGGEDSMGLISSSGRRKSAFEAYSKLRSSNRAGQQPGPGGGIPSMNVILDLCIVPVGVGVSLSPYVAACERVLAEAGLKTALHANGTNIEGEWDKVFAAVKRCHEVVHEMGAPRISTYVHLGTRTDRAQTMEDKIRSVKTKLAEC